MQGRRSVLGATLAVVGLGLGLGLTAHAEPPASAATVPARSRTPAAAGLAAYLSRPVAFSSRFLDHGVLAAAVAGGYPHRYRLGLSLGVLDHLSLGVTAHWLPGASAPRWSPTLAVAVFRGARIEVGAHYFRALDPPPVRDEDPATPSFQASADYLLATATFSQRFVSGGLDVGVARIRETDPGREPTEDNLNPSIIRWRFAGGPHLRVGTRRWGFIANLLGPRIYAEIVFEARFGLFEMRPRGGWKPRETVYSTDRRVPPW